MTKVLKNKKMWVAIGAVAVLAVIVWMAIGNSKEKKVEKEEKVYQVATMEAGETGSDVTLTYTGLVQPEVIEQSTFSSIGNVKEIYVQVGDTVHAGQALAMIDDTDARRQLDTSSNNLSISENTLRSSQRSYDNALKDYEDACNSESEKENLEDAIKKRDEQQIKVTQLETELDEISNSGISGTTSSAYWKKQQEVTSARTTLEAYNQSVDSAQQAYDKKVKEGASSTEAKTQKERLDSATDALTNAQANYDSAQNNYASAQEAVDDCTLKAQNDGYVIEVMATEGGVATPISPAVILGSHKVVASFGVSQSDIANLSAGMPADIVVNGASFTGKIKDIGLMPDENSRTYTTNVTIDTANADFYLGELATVKINIGERLGIWLPLSVILNDGNDYVYVVEDGRAKREYIEIAEMNNDMVMVTGTNPGDLIICEGMKLVRTGSAVSYDQASKQEQ